MNEDNNLTKTDIKADSPFQVGMAYVVNGKEPKEEQERTKIKKRLFLEVYGKTLGSIRATCEAVKISRETYYEWRRIDPEFDFNIRNAWKQKLEDVREQLNHLILKGDGPSIRYFLDRRDPEFMPKAKIIAPPPGEKSGEDDINEYFKENAEGQFELHRGQVLDKGQEGSVGAVQIKSDAGNIPEKKDEAQHMA